MAELNLDDFVNTKHSDVWKYLISADNAISAMYIYKLLITQCLKNKKTTIEKIISGDIDSPEVEIKSLIPDGTIQICEERIEFNSLIYVYTSVFFQECRNFFDYIAQIIVPFFANDGKQYKNISFSTVATMNFGEQESVSAYVKKISESSKYTYLCDYNNTIKHNYNLGIKLIMDTSDYTIHAKIPKFEKRGKKYLSEDLESIMIEMYAFVKSLFVELSDLLQNKIDSQKEKIPPLVNTSDKK